MAGRQQPLGFYRPYDSEDDSGADSETESRDSWSSTGEDQSRPPQGSTDGIPNFQAFATQMQLIDAAGRNFSSTKDAIFYGEDRLGKYTVYSAYDAPVPDLEGEDEYGKTRFTTADGNEVSIVMLDSRYRDRIAYPQPTALSLRLPRVYKNITAIQMAEMKLLTSFYFFRPTKGNTDITIHEQDRSTFTYSNTWQPCLVKHFIRTGSYNIDQLQAEIQLNLNYTPLFYDFINGFNDFVPLFRASGDYAVNFNQPGETFYNNTTNQYIFNPTLDSITNYFWRQRFAGLTSYTTNQVLLAYYYPVLNEALQDDDYPVEYINLEPGIGVDPLVTTKLQVRNRIVYEFTGINPVDQVALAVINANLVNLDKYRLEHTFRYWLVNKYQVSRDQYSQQVFITSPSLNTSLVNLLNLQRNRYFTRVLQLCNLTAAQYAQIQSNVSRALAVTTDMYNYEQTQMLNYFAVPWTQYTLSYYANLTNAILLRDGLDTTGVPSNDEEAISAGIVSFSNTTDLYLRSTPTAWWPNLNGYANSTILMTNLSTATSSFNTVYFMSSSNFNSNQPLIAPSQSNQIYSEYLTNSANAVCPINPAQYTVFQFSSPVRQTMQVETLPRPSVYRLPLYNQSNFGSTINYYYDLSYNFVSSVNYPKRATYQETYDNLPQSNLFQVGGWSVANAQQANPNYSWNRNYASSFAQATSSIILDVTVYNRAQYYTFTAPYVSSPTANSSFTYSLNLTVQFTSSILNQTLVSPPNDMRMFVYHDRGAFQGDVLFTRNENPRFWKYSTVVTANTQLSNTITFTSYQNQTYYVILRADNSNFGTVYPRVVPFFTPGFTITPQSLSVQGLNPQTDICGNTFPSLIQTNLNYAQVYDSNLIRLPINSNLWPPDPSTDPNNQYLQISNVPIGYDTNSVSTDYTDYIPYGFNLVDQSFNPASNLALDPTNQFEFQSNSPYNSTSQLFIYDGGFNSIFTPGLGTTYTPSNVLNRQIKLANYYSPNYIPEPEANFPLPYGSISDLSTTQLAYTSTTTRGKIPGYSYAGTECNIQLGRGVVGFNFIPNIGVWDLKQFMFRSAIYDSNLDPNSNIRYLGIYLMADILGTNVNTISLSSAITVLSNSSRSYYDSTITLQSAGFDVKGGCYYNFVKDTGFVPEVARPILGYTQIPGVMSDQPESMYTAIAFSQYGYPLTIKALSGSAIPYPFYNNIFISTAYLDGTRAYNSTFSVIFPSTVGQTNWPTMTSLSSIYAPSLDGDQTQAQYVLSDPVGTSVLNYVNGPSPDLDTRFLYSWQTDIQPTAAVATFSNYILLQDTNYNIYEFDPYTNIRTLTAPAWQLTPDQIYPSYEYTNLAASAGNSTYFWFLGLSNDDNLNFKLRLKRFNPNTGVLFDYNLPSGFAIPLGGTVQSFTMNDAEQMAIAYQETANTTKFYYNLVPSTTMLTTAAVPGNSNALHTMDPTTSTLYYIPKNTSGWGQTVYEWNIDSASSFPGKLWTPLRNTISTPWNFIGVAAASNVPQNFNRIYLASLSTGIESNVFFNSSINTVASTFQMTAISTSLTTTAGAGQPMNSMSCGYRGALWLTASSAPNVWATRNNDPDITGTLDAAWQIFYPFQKIVLEKVANTYNAITDLTYLNYPEYPHTAMFYYSNVASFQADTSNKWGLESTSNFSVGDADLRGYYFNSYIFNVPLRASSNSNDLQVLTVRGYTPTEHSETLIRFVLPNRYDFGYTTSLDLIFEISNSLVSSIQYNPRYAYTLSNFNTMFNLQDAFWGAGLVPNFDGSNYNSSNFQQFSSNLSTIYAGYQSNAAIIDGITNYVNSNLNYFISTQLRYVLPYSALNRTNYTDPLLFSIKWLSSLLPQYAPLLENWGLGYNLGYAKLDTPYTTYHRAESFYKILEDYIYLRLNPEYQMNRLDTTAKENFNITRDATGQIATYHGKLLLADFNQYSRSFISNQVTFNPPIGRLETMYFQWLDNGGTPIDNFDCDWSASVTITESKVRATVGSTLPALPPMKPLRK